MSFFNKEACTSRCFSFNKFQIFKDQCPSFSTKKHALLGALVSTSNVEEKKILSPHVEDGRNCTTLIYIFSKLMELRITICIDRKKLIA
jgi:hypothetical protein